VDLGAALAEALARLDALGEFRRALIGGIALAVHGVERYTKHVDLAVTRAESAAAERHLGDADPRPLKIGGVSFRTSAGVRVDLVDRRVEFQDLFEAAIDAAHASGRRVSAGDKEAHVVPVPYLVAMKLVADRPQDEADVDALLRRTEVPYPEVRRVVERFLGRYAARRLDRMARAAQRADARADYENGKEYADEA